ncbi:MAG TPA: hypothetical protein VGZ01_05930 [Trinickia sp.]|nr:hypothetical protein [Trinickia sp.]
MPGVMMWREPSSSPTTQDVRSKQDRVGPPKKEAESNDEGMYQFTDKGVATRSLVAVGTREDLATFFRENSTHGIKNNRHDMPDIYMGLFPFERYRRKLDLGAESTGPGKMCVRFSYMPEPGMQQVGTRQVKFGDIGSEFTYMESSFRRRTRTPGAISMWRAPSSQVRKGWPLNFIEDRGVLQKALKAENGAYVFSEHGSGLRPLILIGTYHEIDRFIHEHGNSCIESRIAELPDIYAAAYPLSAVKRFEGLFAGNELFMAGFNQAHAFFRTKFATGWKVGKLNSPSGDGLEKGVMGMTQLELPDKIKDPGSPLFSGIRFAKRLKKPQKKSDPLSFPDDSTRWYVKFSYMKEPHMHLVAHKRLELREFDFRLFSAYGSGKPET